MKIMVVRGGGDRNFQKLKVQEEEEGHHKNHRARANGSPKASFI